MLRGTLGSWNHFSISATFFQVGRPSRLPNLRSWMLPSVVRQLSLETLTFKYWNILFPLIYWSVEAKEDNFITREILMTPPNNEERGLCPSSSKSSLPSCQTDPTTPRTAKVINICVWETRNSNTMIYVFPMTLTPVTGDRNLDVRHNGQVSTVDH